MSTERRHPRVVNVEEVAPREMGKGGFGHHARRLGSEAGGALGCSHYEVQPGKTAFPYHFHSAIEEALYVLEGSGSLRIGKDTVQVRAGDFIAFPPGPANAHALTNTGNAPLRYLALSGLPMTSTLDIVGYPDSKKVAMAAGVTPGKTMRESAWVMKIVKDDVPSAEYFEDEPLAKE